MLLCFLRLLHLVGHCISLLPPSGWTLSFCQIRSHGPGNHRHTLYRLSYHLHIFGSEDSVILKGMPVDWVVVGVSGVTCGGKTTVSAALKEAFPGSITIHQDTYFLPVKDERHVFIPSLKHINWEIASSLDMDKMTSDIKKILSRPASEVDVPLLIIEGFLIFTDPYISSVCQHKVFLTLTYEECWARRSVRTYDPPDVPGYFEQVVWPEYERHLHLTLTMNPDLTLIPGTLNIHSIVQDIRVIVTSELDKNKL